MSYEKMLNDIVLDDFVTAIECVVNDGHNSIAPLGMSGSNYYLHKKEPREQEVSVRLYCGDPELLITNQSKQFLFYGRYDFALGAEFLAQEYFRIFCLLKDEIPKTKDTKKQIKVQPNSEYTVGFKMLEKMLP